MCERERFWLAIRFAQNSFSRCSARGGPSRSLSLDPRELMSVPKGERESMRLVLACGPVRSECVFVSFCFFLSGWPFRELPGSVSLDLTAFKRVSSPDSRELKSYPKEAYVWT